MSPTLKAIKELSANLNPSELIEAFELISLAVEKNKTKVQNRQKKVKHKISELNKYKIFK